MHAAAATTSAQGSGAAAAEAAPRRACAIASQAPKNSPATASRSAPTHTEASCGGARLCAVPVVPHSAAAASTSATPRSGDTVIVIVWVSRVIRPAPAARR